MENPHFEFEQDVIKQALRILEYRMAGIHEAPQFGSTGDIANFLKLQFADFQNERFGAVFMDNHNRLIAFQILFSGTVGYCAVYPREVAKRALAHNASNVVVAHNHQPGNPRPSGSDVSMTKTLGDSLKQVDIRLLDHVIVSGTELYSMREQGDFNVCI